MNKKDVLITIKGLYVVDDDSATSELYTRGKMYRCDGDTVITYEETETTGYEGCTTTLKLADSGDCVTMIRTGSTSSHLVLQKGIRNVGSYDVYGASMEIGVTTHDLAWEKSAQGGRLRLRYTLDMNALFMSENELDIDIEQS